MRAAIYARMSTDKQSADSPADQIARCHGELACNVADSRKGPGSLKADAATVAAADALSPNTAPLGATDRNRRPYERCDRDTNGDESDANHWRKTSDARCAMDHRGVSTATSLTIATVRETT